MTEKLLGSFVWGNIKEVCSYSETENAEVSYQGKRKKQDHSNNGNS